MLWTSAFVHHSVQRLVVKSAENGEEEGKDHSQVRGLFTLCFADFPKLLVVLVKDGIATCTCWHLRHSSDTGLMFSVLYVMDRSLRQLDCDYGPMLLLCSYLEALFRHVVRSIIH